MDKAKLKCSYRKNGVSRRVTVIRGGSDSAFEEAIFILRDNEGLCENDFLAEAEKLAADYMHPACVRRRVTPGFWILAGCSFLSLAAWVVYILIT